jgi:type I restriction enzyme, S subunit
MLPKGWKQFDFAEVAEVGSGQVDPRNEPYASMIHIGPENIESGTGRIVSPKKCSELGLISGKYEFDEEAVVYSKIRPHLNKVCFPAFKGVCSADAYPIWPDKTKLLPGYLKQYMLGNAFEKRAVACSMRTGMPKINREDLDGIPVVVPPLDEQRRITQILSIWDQAVLTTERLSANSQRRTRDLMASLLSGRRRFPGMSEKWRYVDFDSVFERVSRKNTAQNTNVLTISGEYGLISQRDYFNKSVASANLTGYTLLRQREFAYNKSYSSGYPMGAIKPLLAYETGVVSSLYLCFKLREDADADFDFFRHYFEAGHLNQEIEGIAQEGARNHGLLNVSVTDFFKLQLHIPIASEQRRIAEILNVAKAEEMRLEAQLQALRQEKAALMSQLLTGKRRVKLPKAGSKA